MILINAVGAISMMNVSTGASKAYSYIVNLSGVSTFIVWAAISFMHLRFRRAMRVQNRSLDELPFKSLLFPWIAIFGFVLSVFLALVQGWTTFSPFDAGDFVDAYILIPVSLVGYIIYKFVYRTRFWRAREIDLDIGRRQDLDSFSSIISFETQDDLKQEVAQEDANYPVEKQQQA